MNLKQMITETIKYTINEEIALNNEASNIYDITKALENVYNRIISKGISKNEVTVMKIAKMIQDLKNIQRYWSHVSMW
jgi:hypothetical protein